MYKYKNFQEVLDAFDRGELNDYKLDIDFDWVCLMRKDGKMSDQDMFLWDGSQPDFILFELMKNKGVPLNE